MIKRFVWFVSGLVTGVMAVVFTGRKVRRRVDKVTNLTPIKVVRDATSSVRNTVSDMGDAVREGRDAMRHKEAELRARVEGRATPLDEELEASDAVLVDGEPVEPGRVVVLRQIDPGFVSDAQPVSRPPRKNRRATGSRTTR